MLKGLRKLCDKSILLILDEVQCGIGRSGDFAFDKSRVKPDIVPIAKGIGGGFPIGAVLMNKVASGMVPGTHGSTFRQSTCHASRQYCL